MGYLNTLARPVDAVIVTGDIADHGTAAEYQQAAAVLRSNQPVYIAPGNHDDRQTFGAELLDRSTSGPINSAHRVGELMVILCDSTIPQRPEGLLDDETLDFLRSTLDEAPADSPVLIGLHHPPTPLYTPIVDPMLLTNPADLADIVAGDERIVGVMCGHAHTSAVTTFAGKPLVIAPSVNSVLGPDWEGGGAVGGKPVVDYSVPPSIALHVIDDDRRLTTHFRVVTDQLSGTPTG